MKIILALATLSILQLSTAQAQQPPKPADSNVVRISELKNIYAAGAQATEKSLIGEWVNVAIATNTECGFMGEDAYDVNGLKNSDGSLLKLAFKTVSSSGGNFSGKASANLTVSLLNLGEKAIHQGPYKVDPNEPQFAQFSYTQYGNLSELSYFSYNCRLVANNDHRMVCLLQLVDGDPNSADVNKSCAASNNGLAFGFIKVK